MSVVQVQRSAEATSINDDIYDFNATIQRLQTTGCISGYDNPNCCSGDIVISSTISAIPDDAFSEAGGCRSQGKCLITSVTFPNTITLVGERAFELCTT